MVDDAEVERWSRECSMYCRQRCEALTEESAGGKYLIGRGFDLAVMRRFGVGFDPKCTGHNSKVKYGRPAVVLPYNGLRNYYTARVLKVKDGHGKYIRPPENRLPRGWSVPVFHSKQLYAEGLEVVIVTEGELDALAVSQAAMASALPVGAVATGGASNWRALFEILKDRRPSVRLVIGYDFDASGRREALRFSEALAGIGQPVSILNDWDGEKDAGDLLARNAEDLIELLQGVLSGDDGYFIELNDLRVIVDAEAEEHGDFH